MQHNVYIEGNDLLVRKMFETYGHNIVKHVGAASVIVFTGGEDIDSRLYHEDPIPECGKPNRERDEREVKLWRSIRYQPTIKVGICRGGQFLNVMNGGTLWQHVNNHTRDHQLSLQNTSSISVGGYKKINSVTSTHHQMMLPSKGGELVGYANEATLKKGDERGYAGNMGNDAEIIYYKESNSLCFQPHPEYNKETAEVFFGIFNQLSVEGKK